MTNVFTLKSLLRLIVDKRVRAETGEDCLKYGPSYSSYKDVVATIMNSQHRCAMVFNFKLVMNELNNDNNEISDATIK